MALRDLSTPVMVSLTSTWVDHDHGDHGHAEAAEDPRPGVVVTLYQSGLELFMEHPAFVAGQDSRLIAHFTDVRDPDRFVWVTSGQVAAILRYSDGTEERFVAEKPLRNGVFTPTVKPSRAGEATLTLTLEGEVSGTVEVGAITVYPSVEAAVAATPPEEAGEPTVAYLKETQWKTAYATAPAERRAHSGSIRANAEIQAQPGHLVELVAPFSGRVEVAGPAPEVGMPVKKGQALFSLVPVSEGDAASAGAALARAASALTLAERELARLESLATKEFASQAQLDAARAAVEVARADQKAASSQRSAWQGASGAGTALTVRAPIDGVVAMADLTPGALVQGGERLLIVVEASRVRLVAHVPDTDAVGLEGSPGARFTLSGTDASFSVAERGGRLVAVGAAVDPATRTVPVIYELDNADGRLKPGMFAAADLYTASVADGLAIPETAVVDDGGVPIVYVMEGGETFVARRVRLGPAQDGLVLVLDGVRDGERVVSRGAYEIKLAAASGTIPEHGHAH